MSRIFSNILCMTVNDLLFPAEGIAVYRYLQFTVICSLLKCFGNVNVILLLNLRLGSMLPSLFLYSTKRALLCLRWLIQS